MSFRIIFYSALLIILSCTLLEISVKNDSDLKQYVKQFENLTGVTRTNLDIGFKEFNDDRISGVCYYALNTIAINKTHWIIKEEIERKSLIYHELGHCFCWRGHDETKLLDGCPASLMHPYNIGIWCLEKHWLSYIKDLRNKCNE